jgi:hypothetical protein
MEEKKVTPRCCGFLASGAACQRKRQTGEFCNQHFKSSQNLVLKLIEVNGIVRYVDDKNAVYCTESVLAKDSSPPVVSQCMKNERGEYVMC